MSFSWPHVMSLCSALTCFAVRVRYGLEYPTTGPEIYGTTNYSLGPKRNYQVGGVGRGCGSECRAQQYGKLWVRLLVISIYFGSMLVYLGLFLSILDLLSATKWTYWSRTIAHRRRGIASATRRVACGSRGTTPGSESVFQIPQSTRDSGLYFTHSLHGVGTTMTCVPWP